jgi:hypothetical protein
MNVVKSLVLGLVAVVVLAAPVHAQESLVDAATLEARVLADEPIRAELSTLLATDEVRQIAEERGVDLAEVDAAARTLSDAQIQAATPLIERATEALERRNTVTISVYTIIIFLLILILIT